MSEVAQRPPEAAPAEDAGARVQPLWRRLPPDVRPLALVVLVSTLVYAVVGLVEAFPQTYPDEFLYQGLAESLANGDGLEIRGRGQDLLSLLYVIAVAPAWVLGVGDGAYSLAKVLNAAYMSLTAVPVWLLARELTGSARRALVPATLTLLGSWMLFAHQILSENVALPLATAALAATVVALRAPGSRWWLAAVALAALAGFARTHLLALGLVVLAAPFLDALRQPRGARVDRLRAHAPWAAVLAGLGALAAIVLAASGLSVLGRHEALADAGAPLGDALAWSARHALAVVVMGGFVPGVAVLALGARSRNWRDDTTGPLLVVLLAAFCVLVGLAGWYTAAEPGWLVERYVVYLVPPTLVVLVLAPGRVGLRAAVASAVALAAAMLALPDARQFAEAKAVNAARELASGAFEAHPEIGVALFALVVGVAGAVLLALRRPLMPALPPPPAKLPKGSAARARALRERAERERVLSFRLRRALAQPGSGAPLALALTAAVLVVGGARTVGLEADFAQAQRGNVPADLGWVDAATGDRPVGTVTLEPRLNEVPDLTAFFNRNIDAGYHLKGIAVRDLGANCELTIGPDGTLGSRPPCGPPPPDLLIEDAVSRAHLHAERSRQVSVNAGNLVRTSERRPRLMSVITPPCNIRLGTCRDFLRLRMWLDRPETVALTLIGSTEQESIVLPDGKVLELEPNALSKVTLTIPAGDQDVRLPVSWDVLDGPQLKSAVIERPGGDVVLY